MLVAAGAEGRVGPPRVRFSLIYWHSFKGNVVTESAELLPLLLNKCNKLGAALLASKSRVKQREWWGGGGNKIKGSLNANKTSLLRIVQPFSPLGKC